MSLTKVGIKLPKEEYKLQRFPCSYPQCDKSYGSKQRVRLHVEVFHLKQELKFACTVCKFRTCEKSDLRAHLRIHNGQKPYGCRFCDRSFALAGNRNDHEKRHSKIKPYVCDNCQEGFYRNNIKEKHFKKCIEQSNQSQNAKQKDKTANQSSNYSQSTAMPLFDTGDKISSALQQESLTIITKGDLSDIRKKAKHEISKQNQSEISNIDTAMANDQVISTECSPSSIQENQRQPFKTEKLKIRKKEIKKHKRKFDKITLKKLKITRSKETFIAPSNQAQVKYDEAKPFIIGIIQALELPQIKNNINAIGHIPSHKNDQSTPPLPPQNIRSATLSIAMDHPNDNIQNRLDDFEKKMRAEANLKLKNILFQKMVEKYLEPQL